MNDARKIGQAIREGDAGPDGLGGDLTRKESEAIAEHLLRYFDIRPRSGPSVSFRAVAEMQRAVDAMERQQEIIDQKDAVIRELSDTIKQLGSIFEESKQELLAQGFVDRGDGVLVYRYRGWRVPFRRREERG